MELVFDGQRTTLPLSADHDVDGKYYALVSPSEPGYYQVNVLGRVGQTDFNKALHAPKVENREFIRFPVPEDPVRADLDRIEAGLERLEEKVSDLGDSSPDPAAVYGLPALALALAASSMALVLYRRR